MDDFQQLLLRKWKLILRFFLLCTLFAPSSLLTFKPILSTWQDSSVPSESFFPLLLCSWSYRCNIVCEVLALCSQYVITILNIWCGEPLGCYFWRPPCRGRFLIAPQNTHYEGSCRMDNRIHISARVCKGSRRDFKNCISTSEELLLSPASYVTGAHVHWNICHSLHLCGCCKNVVPVRESFWLFDLMKHSLVNGLTFSQPLIYIYSGLSPSLFFWSQIAAHKNIGTYFPFQYMYKRTEDFFEILQHYQRGTAVFAESIYIFIFFIYSRIARSLLTISEGGDLMGAAGWPNWHTVTCLCLCPHHMKVTSSHLGC